MLGRKGGRGLSRWPQPADEGGGGRPLATDQGCGIRVLYSIYYPPTPTSAQVARAYSKNGRMDLGLAQRKQNNNLYGRVYRGTERSQDSEEEGLPLARAGGVEPLKHEALKVIPLR